MVIANGIFDNASDIVRTMYFLATVVMIIVGLSIAYYVMRKQKDIIQRLEKIEKNQKNAINKFVNYLEILEKTIKKRDSQIKNLKKRD